MEIVLVVPPVEKGLVGVPRLEGFVDDRTFVVVAEEVVALNLPLNLGPRVPFLFEAEGLVEYLA